MEKLKKTIRRVLDKAQKYLPHYGYYKENGVVTKKKYLLDGYINNRKNNDSKEDGIVKCHDKLTKEGDKVLIIGGGKGVTSVRASWIVGDSGKVIIYEGGKESIREIESNIEKNGVGKICSVRHSIVGPEKNVYGGNTQNASNVSADELPKCDVLELDCEGSEIKIMKKMKIRPRVIISEMHPWNTEYEVKRYVNIFEEVGYKMICAYGHDGIGISGRDLNELLSRSKEQGKRYVDSGARWPVVMAGVRSV